MHPIWTPGRPSKLGMKVVLRIESLALCIEIFNTGFSNRCTAPLALCFLWGPPFEKKITFLELA